MDTLLNPFLRYNAIQSHQIEAIFDEESRENCSCCDKNFSGKKADVQREEIGGNTIFLDKFSQLVYFLFPCHLLLLKEKKKLEEEKEKEKEKEDARNLRSRRIRNLSMN
jgi:hypothetical protein